MEIVRLSEADLQAARTGLSFDSKHADLYGLEARARDRRGHETSAAARAALGHGAKSRNV